jgi:molybdopterin-containing oxidoreductase family iron-sulfur binding subunit
LLAILVGDSKTTAEKLVRETFQSIAGTHDWEHTLDDGLLPDSDWPTETPALLSKEPGDAMALLPVDRMGDGLEIVFTADPAVYDGRFANSGWLQELPRPLTKLTWDNAAIFNPATAAKLGVTDQMLVRLKYDGRQLEMPAFILPGQAAGSVAVALGFGRTAAGKVGGSREDLVEPVGVDVYPLRTSEAMQFAGGLTVEPTGKQYPLAVTQDHFAMDIVGNEARTKRVKTLAQEATLQHYQEDPDFAKHAVEHPPLKSLWAEPGYEGHRWGMAIDLSRCTGCNACVVACQAENNVPVVGKSRVLRGREMHWIRIDRYFQGAPEEPSVVHQPVACQQCEMAPCEQVCPVAATVHSKEGLNDMVYNRCVGTRYCANNCPYKVRRFNFFNYHKDLEQAASEVLKMVYNPEVTVRSRGVMEKCTYCVQRIQAVKIHAKNEQRAIADGEITTACQQACPAGAITFGDLNDPHSQVRQAHSGHRAYALLGELNTKPRTAYQARIRNPNPELVTDL